MGKALSECGLGFLCKGNDRIGKWCDVHSMSLVSDDGNVLSFDVNAMSVCSFRFDTAERAA